MVVLTRLLAGDLPDRVGPARVAIGAAAGRGRRAWSRSPSPTACRVALPGALAMGAAFSLLYPSLSLIVVDRSQKARRGAAMGTYTAFFDAGVGLGAPLAGLAAALTELRGRVSPRGGDRASARRR